MNVVVFGSRGFKDYSILEDTLDSLRRSWGDFTIISGGAAGADSLAAHWAKQRNLPLRIFKPQWDKYGKRAGPMRNTQMVNESDRGVGFWDGSSRGSKDTADKLHEAGKPLHLVVYTKGLTVCSNDG